MVRYYVHGAGVAGKEAWPTIGDDGAVFADHSMDTAMTQKAVSIADQAPSQRHALIAHSLGAVAAMLAISQRHLRPTHLILLEPALYDLARGDEAIERHITLMTQARQRAERNDIFGFWEIVSPLMFGQPASEERWSDDRVVAEHFAALDSPWGHGITPAAFDGVATLVISGGWNDEYEAIAFQLTAAGAAHVQLEGTEHRPQDHPDFARTVQTFIAD